MMTAGHGKLDKIGCLGFNLMSNDLFTNGYAGGTYRVSNLSVTYTNPPVFKITQIVNNEQTGLTLTWDSKPGAAYTIELKSLITDPT